MFREIVRWELVSALRRISTYVYFGIFFALSFLMMTAMAGAWPSVNVMVGTGGGNILANSPHSVASVTSGLGLFMVIIVAAVMGQAVFRDFESRIHPLLYTTPMSKLAYLGGRFVGAVLTLSIIALSIPAGLASAASMPWLDAERIGTTVAGTYMQPYAVFLLPTIFIAGVVFFTLAALTRRMLPNYLGGVGLLLGYMVAEIFVADIQTERLASFLDPFGLYAHYVATKFWTVAQKNALLIPLEGDFLLGRLLWLGVAAAGLAVFVRAFRLSHFSLERKVRRRDLVDEEARRIRVDAPLHVPAANRRFGAAASLKQLAVLTRRSMAEIVLSPYFVAIAAAGVIFIGINATQIGKWFGTPVWPVTYMIVEALSGIFALFMLIILTFYAGEMVWRERDLKMQQVQDALPVRSWVPFVAKLAALVVMVAVLQAVVLLSGIMIQASQGYTNFEIGLYVSWLFGLNLVDYALVAVLALTVHIVVNHKYLGHLVMILYYGVVIFLPQFGLEHNLYNYGSGGGVTYSDMNAYGHYLGPWVIWRLYWTAFALLLLLGAHLFWVRGEEAGMRSRVRTARARLTPKLASTGAMLLLLFAASGTFVFYNTNVLNEYETSYESEVRRAEFERLYKQYDGLTQPRIDALDLKVEIYPSERELEITATYRLVNRSTEPIEEVHLVIDRRAEVEELAFGLRSELTYEGEDNGYRIFRLERPLGPAEETNMRFVARFESHGFENQTSSGLVVHNGTFFNNTILPTIGYDRRVEISDEHTRRKHGLDPRPRMADYDDSDAWQHHFIARDSDFISFEAVLGTEPDQIAIAPGDLVDEWEEDGRRYFHYRMEPRVLNFFSFVSARYEVLHDRWGDVDIEIYHHPTHQFNLERMVDGIKASLDYFTAEFGPYPHRVVRILEFPRYAAFAQSFPNTIPYSEAIGFIARPEGPDDVDYPFYVTAHEVAHQWFGHQIVPADVQGSQFLSESLSQYGAMMVMEHAYGRDGMRRFLRYELDQYLMGRGMERMAEMPLILVENQGYIHYQKGSIVMYAVRDYLGEETVNRVIREFLEDRGGQGPPFPTAMQFYDRLTEAAPDSLRPLLVDWFEEITLYENRTSEATWRQLEDGRYEVILTVEGRKLRSDAMGNEEEVAMSDPVDIGVFASSNGNRSGWGEVLYLEKHYLTAGSNEIRLVVDRQPSRAGVDPYHKLVDRFPDANTMRVREAGTD